MYKKAISILLVCFIILITSTLAIGKEKEKSAIDYLPQINEVYNQAVNFDIIDGWEDNIKVEAYDFKALPEIKKAFEVGKTLADIAFIIMNEKDPRNLSSHILETAKNAILSLDPPKKTKEKLEEIQDGVKTGILKGEGLRKELDLLVSKVIPEIEADPNLRDVGTLVWASGFFRAMYHGTNTVARKEAPTQEQLAMFRYGGVISYFLEYFTQRAKESFKNNTQVKNLVVALKEIKPIVEKDPKKITKKDIENVARALKESRFN